MFGRLLMKTTNMSRPVVDTCGTSKVIADALYKASPILFITTIFSQSYSVLPPTQFYRESVFQVTLFQKLKSLRVHLFYSNEALNRLCPSGLSAAAQQSSFL